MIKSTYNVVEPKFPLVAFITIMDSLVKRGRKEGYFCSYCELKTCTQDDARDYFPS